MYARNLLSTIFVGAILAGMGTAHAQESTYGMLFQQKSVVTPAIKPDPPLVLNSRPLTQSDVDAAVANTQRAPTTPRQPSPADLARMHVPSVASAAPATFEQQQEARLAAWQAQEEKRIDEERTIRLAQESESKKQVIVVQQQDPFLSNLLAIPRAIGYLFGGRTVR